MKKRKWLLIAIPFTLITLACAAWMITCVPADGFALRKSPLRFHYYSRFELDRKPIVDFTLGNVHIVLPRTAPDRLKALAKDRDDVAGVIVFENATHRPVWSQIQFPGFGAPRVYDYYTPTGRTDKENYTDVLVPYARNAKRRESIIQIEKVWYKAVLPVPPPGKERKKTVFTR